MRRVCEESDETTENGIIHDDINLWDLRRLFVSVN
jgi:hypothetical protein